MGRSIVCTKHNAHFVYCNFLFVFWSISFRFACFRNFYYSLRLWCLRLLCAVTRPTRLFSSICHCVAVAHVRFVYASHCASIILWVNMWWDWYLLKHDHICIFQIPCGRWWITLWLCSMFPQHKKSLTNSLLIDSFVGTFFFFFSISIRHSFLLSTENSINKNERWSAANYHRIKFRSRQFGSSCGIFFFFLSQLKMWRRINGGRRWKWKILQANRANKLNSLKSFTLDAPSSNVAF